MPILLDPVSDCSHKPGTGTVYASDHPTNLRCEAAFATHHTSPRQRETPGTFRCHFSVTDTYIERFPSSTARVTKGRNIARRLQPTSHPNTLGYRQRTLPCVKFTLFYNKRTLSPFFQETFSFFSTARGTRTVILGDFIHRSAWSEVTPKVKLLDTLFHGTHNMIKCVSDFPAIIWACSKGIQIQTRVQANSSVSNQIEQRKFR